MSTIRIAQYFELITFPSDRAASIYGSNGGIGQEGRDFYADRGQNYFINETKHLGGKSYNFIPFRAEGSISNLNGDNGILQLLLPSHPVVIRLAERSNGNRLSQLLLTTVWLNAALAITKSYEERYIGTGCSYSETTVELRFRSAMDSVGSQFPARRLTRDLVGILPLNADLVLQ